MSKPKHISDIRPPISSKPSERHHERASVELRSDAFVGGVHNKKSPIPLQMKVLIAIAGSTALLIIGLVSGLVVLHARGGASKEISGTGASKLFGELPLIGDRDSFSSNESGLSGRTCDNANRRAIGVMLAGDPINRPVSGFAQADQVWELPVLVSGVTRLLAVYQCGRPADIGSIRSARHDYLFLGEGVDAIVGHWGGSYHALNRIRVGEFETIDALTNPHNAYFRKQHLPAPYNGFSTYENLWNALQKLGYRTTTKFKGYSFKDDPALVERAPAGTLSIGWPGQFRVHYEYNPVTNRYNRFWAGLKQVDGDDGALVTPSVVAIMRATNSYADGPGGYNDVGIEGEGNLEVYQDGRVINGRWKKNDLFKKDPVHFMDEAGKEITFTRGQVWIMAVEPDVQVTWKVAEQAVPTSS